jgi:hypothetical protein
MRKKSDPIMMKDKEDLGVDSEGTEAETTTMEIETNQKNLKKDMQSNNELENMQTGTVSLDKSGTRSSIWQRKPQNQCQMIFYGSRIFECRL